MAKRPTKLKWSPEAVQDLLDVQNFCKQHPRRGSTHLIVNQIRKKARLLLSFPKLGKVYVDSEGISFRNIRYLAGVIKIAYTIEGENLIIICVFDGRQDPRKFNPTERLKN